MAVDQHRVERRRLRAQVDDADDVDADAQVRPAVALDLGVRRAEQHDPRRAGQLDEHADVQVHQPGPQQLRGRARPR